MAPEREVPDDGIDRWVRGRFGLRTGRKKDVWLLCIGVAIELEGLAVGVLWAEDGEPGRFQDYDPRMTLGAAKDNLERRGLLSQATRNILKAVADLRNSVAHRHAGFPDPAVAHSGPPTGHYRGQDVFRDEGVPAQLIKDADMAAQEMWALIATRHVSLQANRPQRQE